MVGAVGQAMRLKIDGRHGKGPVQMLSGAYMATLPKEQQKKAYEESKLSQSDKDYLHSDIKSEYKASKLRQGDAAGMM